MITTKTYLRSLALGLAIASFSPGMLQAQTVLDPAWRVTPDTTKPGFLWNYFQAGVNTGDSNARAESDLAGLSTDATGALRPNVGDPTVVGAAITNAAPANPANGLLFFEIAGVINLSKTEADTKGNFTPDELEPGVNTVELTDGQAAEILTYLTLPAGTITMGVNSDDGFQTASGPNPRDAIGRLTLGEYNGGRGAGDTLFTFQVQQAGTYPFRTIWENGGGDSNIEWFTVDPDGVSNRKLINDVANGGIPAYRALAGVTVTPPYVKLVTPAAVPRQAEKSSRNLTVTLADGTNPVDDNSVTLKVDGQSAAITKQRQGNTLTVDTGVVPGFHVAAEAHTAELTFKDSTGTYSRTQQWTFYNLENLILPASPVTGENFDSYPEAADPTTAAPPGWVLTNFSWLETGASGFGGNGGAVWDLTGQANDPFLNWCMIDTNTAATLEKEILDNYQAQTINGIPLTNGWMSGNCLFAASDSRARHCSVGGSNLPDDYAPQIQIAVSAPFNLSTVTNPVLTFSSGVRISGNGEEDGLEYSVDNGTNWLPAIFMFNANRLFSKSDGSYDAVKILTNVWPDVAKFPVVQDPTTRDFISAGPLGQKFGDVLVTPISAALAPYIANRNDTSLSRKVEAIRLPAASKKSQVRLRFNHYGSCGWEWAVDNIAFYDIAPTVSAPAVGANIGLNFGADEPSGSSGGSLASTNLAGVVPQANWNNLRGNAGTNTAIVGDSGAASGLSVTWTCPNTWSSTGRGEENNKFPTGSADRKLMTGYLDTDNAAGVAKVTVSGLDSAFGGAAYDVIVYALGGTSTNRYGAYSIGTVTNIINSAANPTNFVQDAGVNITDKGDYGVFKELTGNSFTLIASAVTPVGNGTRAPVNAVQIVKSPPRLAITPQGNNVVITLPTGLRLQSATSLNAPVNWSDVPGTSPITLPASAAQTYYRGVSP